MFILEGTLEWEGGGGGGEQKLMAATLGPHMPDPVLTTHHPALLRLCFIKKRID